MVYRPRHCNECGELIERERWRFWHSTRFCDHCAAAHRFPRLGRIVALMTIGLVVGLAAGSWIEFRRQRPAPELRIERRPPSPAALMNPPQLPQQNSENAPAKPPQLQPKNKTLVGICGAPTKSGKACQRRVKSGGRCYQHRQTASNTP
jgi:hypothetical protein